MAAILSRPQCVNTLRPRQDGGRFPDDTFERIFLNKNVIILIKISLKFVPNGPINNIPALVQIMTWRRSSDKQLSEPMMGRLPTHICVTRPQWVKSVSSEDVFWIESISPSCVITLMWIPHNAFDGKSSLVQVNGLVPPGNKLLPESMLSKIYRKLSNIRRNKFQTLNVSRLVLQLSLPNPMKPGVKSRMKM